MTLEKLEKDYYYHIYNRGINNSIIFQNEANMSYFLVLTEKYLTGKAAIIAYCLMNNHFHFIVKIIEDDTVVCQAFSNLFNAYAKAYNKQQDRTGSLFEKHFKRKKITDETYLINSIIYVHNNPVNHNVVKSSKDYLFSSYNDYLSDENKRNIISKSDFVRLFDTIDNFEIAHQQKISSDLEVEDLYLQGFENLAGSFENLAGSFENLAGKQTNNQEKPLDLQGFKNLAGNFENLAGKQTNDQEKPLDLQGFENLAGSFKNLAGSFKNRIGNESMNLKEKFYSYIHNLQDTITAKLEAVDGKATFKEDLWERPEGGGGRTCVIENGNVFEKGGVNISGVHGKLPKSMQTYFNVGEVDFFACGISLVLHPKNPMIPTVHANWRYFEMYNETGHVIDQWFGGGQDLTPYYLFEEDTIHFHKTCKTVCDSHHPDFYKNYKKQCDTYFYNAHRNEARGIGGLFFDYCKASETMSMQKWYDFVTDVGNSFLEAYVPIVEKRKQLPYTEAHRNWQEIRRGRYVEFNLVHDKGTLFGLRTNGRIESILMSLPPHVQWVYDHHPEPGSAEEKLLNVLKNPVDWVSP